jgi:hypothetical protein
VSPPGPFAAISPRSPRHALEDLIVRGDRAAAAGKERPLVSLELASGRQLEGRAVAIADDGGLAVVLLHTGGSERAPQVLHLRIDVIVAVGYLAGQDKPVEQAAPGRLELARSLSSSAEALTDKLGSKLALVLADPLDDDQRRAVAAMLPALRPALTQLAADAMGKEALTALAAIRIGAAASRGVVKTSGELHIDAPLPPADEWLTGELVTEIEKAL